MGNELELFGGGGRGDVARPTRRQRRAAEQADLELFQLVHAGRQEEIKALIRKRLVESGMEDVTDVAYLARELADGDAYIASLLIPIVTEYSRSTAEDIYNFGRGQ